jgi:hypothetical protein
LPDAVTGSRQVSADAAARVLLGAVARGENVPVEALEDLAHAVLDADPIARLVLRVLDSNEPHRLARAIELAGAVLDPNIAHADVETRRRSV